MLLPAPALALWVVTIGYGCLTDWVSIGPYGVQLGATLQCFTTLLIASVQSFAVLVLMRRHAARLDPTMVAMMGGLASAGIAATALSLFHELDATVMVVAVGGVFGRRIFGWTSPQRLDVVQERR